MNRLRAIISILTGLAIAAVIAAPTAAYDVKSTPIAVVELFTSQGCSRCPEADRLLAELGERSDVVALAYHIDYWDYAGWEDTFASPANTNLQKAYAASWGKSRVYTPHMVVNGSHGMVGSQRNEVMTTLEGAHLPVAVSFARAGADAMALSAPGMAGARPAIVWLVTYRGHAEVEIGNGENSGKVLTYSHIVTARQPIGMWDPTTGVDITMPVDAVMGENEGAAILIQEKHGDLPGPIIGALALSR